MSDIYLFNICSTKAQNNTNNDKLSPKVSKNYNSIAYYTIALPPSNTHCYTCMSTDNNKRQGNTFNSPAFFFIVPLSLSHSLG